MKDLSIYTNDFINYCRLHKGLSAKTLRAYSIDLNQLWERTHGRPEQSIYLPVHIPSSQKL